MTATVLPKLIMTGLDHKSASLDIREQFALTKEKTRQILAAIKENNVVGGCVIVSTCNRTELYASVLNGNVFEPTKILCNLLGKNIFDFKDSFTERVGNLAMEHLCRVASGLDSQILGDAQIITQVREALELSRAQNCTDSYMETMSRLAIQAAKAIKTNVVFKSPGADSVPGKAVDKLKTLCKLAGKNAVVIGNGWMGRLVAKLLIDENANVTVTLREHKKGFVQIPDGANAISYNERYKAIEQADMVISATTSPHFTLCHKELTGLTQQPSIIMDLAVPRDVEPSVKEIPGIALLTIDDISDENRSLSAESILMIDNIIEEHIKKYYHWLEFKRVNAA
ncbi:MAG: glutamyl-tRNA reductase [Fibromonadales bacterium]|nr:glutamyl-tRNA reductase [Fibromonadales bacterium]